MVQGWVLIRSFYGIGRAGAGQTGDGLRAVGKGQGGAGMGDRMLGRGRGGRSRRDGRLGLPGLGHGGITREMGTGRQAPVGRERRAAGCPQLRLSLILRG